MHSKIKCFLLLACTLLVLSGCKEIHLDGFNECVEKVRVTLTQGNKSQTATLTPKNGRVEFEIDSDKKFEINKSVTLTAKVVSVKKTVECEEASLLKGNTYTYTGVPETTNDGDIFTPGNLRNGEASFGTRRGNNSRRILLWAGPDVAASCTNVCWEQWASLRMFLKDSPGGEREIRPGAPWTDKTGRAQVHGTFGRDIPEGSNGNCFRLDPVPGLDNTSGIVDAPGIDTEDTPTETFEQRVKKIGRAAIRDGADRNEFTVSYRFEMRSILICNDSPRRTIGYYTWTAQQDFTFKRDATTGQTKYETNYKLGDPTWTAGKNGLPSDISAP